jgi:hypothetical protein
MGIVVCRPGSLTGQWDVGLWINEVAVVRLRTEPPVAYRAQESADGRILLATR